MIVPSAEPLCPWLASHTHTHARAHTHTYTHTHTRTHARTHACTLARSHRHTHTHCTLAQTHTRHTYTFAHTHTRTHTHTHRHTHTHTLAQTHTHTHAHTHTHTLTTHFRIIHISSGMNLFRAQNTRQELVLRVGRTRQSPTVDVGVVEDVPLAVCLRSFDGALAGIDADELGRAGVVWVASHDVAGVFLGPARGAGVGSGNEDGDGTRDTAHSASRGQQTARFRADAVFRAVDVRKPVARWLLVVVQDWV